MTPDPPEDARPPAGRDRDEIPRDQLPGGFGRDVERPREPATPRPAATVVLLRDHDDGLQVLLLGRNRRVGFVPGAYVFPGGRVDAEDAAPALLERLRGVTPEEAARRLDLPDGDPPAVAYWVAALREAFEETGILVGRTADGDPPPTGAQEEEVLALRETLLEDEARFPEVLDRLGCVMDGGAVEYVAHWITPQAEPRRYDTRFFAAAVPGGSEVVLDDREMVDAVWLTPAAALERNEAGGLPMVFPTLKTLEALRELDSAEAVLEHYRGREIPTIMPRLVETPTGVAIEMEGEGEEA